MPLLSVLLVMKRVGLRKTLRNGTRVLERMLDHDSLTGEGCVFVLQSTYGFPKELTLSLAEEKGIAGFFGWL